MSEQIHSLARHKDQANPAIVEIRPLYVIAREIRRDWGSKLNYAARPYLDAMQSLDTIGETYYQDSAASVVRYFLSNATTWKGDVARRVKAELKAMLKTA
jgi:hypothetical protein